MQFKLFLVSDSQVDLGEDRPHPLTDDTRSCEGVRSVMPRPKELLKIRQQKKVISDNHNFWYHVFIVYFVFLTVNFGRY